MKSEEIQNLKDAIIELYLAIKIRSSEELDEINEGQLVNEKEKLLKLDGFQVLEYIRSSIEIIMNLKIEDLDRDNSSQRLHKENNGVSSDSLSVTSQKFVHQSMKDALANQNGNNQESQKGSSASDLEAKIDKQKQAEAFKKQQRDELPNQYEKMLQKLEADIRGHIRLEHEMKIHLDYLEERVEYLENQNLAYEQDIKKKERKISQIGEELLSNTKKKDKELSDSLAQNQALQDELLALQKSNEQMVDKYEKEIEMYNSVNNLEQPTTDFSTIQHPSSSNKKSDLSYNDFNDKNIYQTISDIQGCKTPVQIFTRNNIQLNDKRSLKEKLHLQMAIAGNNSTKKVRQLSQSSKGSAQAIHRSMKVDNGGLLELSNRNSSNNVERGMNPYHYGTFTQKKHNKKKAESMDLVSNTTGIRSKSKVLKNPHNQSVINEADQKWLMNSADSDLHSQQPKNQQSSFVDYPLNYKQQPLIALYNEGRNCSQVSQGHEIIQTKTHGNPRYASINDKNMQRKQQTTDCHLNQDDALRKNIQKSAIKQSVDYNALPSQGAASHMPQHQKHSDYQRPSSNLGRPIKQNSIAMYTVKPVIFNKEKSSNKSRLREDSVNSSSSNQAKLLHIKERDRKQRLIQSYASYSQGTSSQCLPCKSSLNSSIQSINPPKRPNN